MMLADNELRERERKTLCFGMYILLQTIREVSSDEEYRYFVGGPQNWYKLYVADWKEGGTLLLGRI